MYIATVPNRNSPPAILLRESFREDGKVKNRTLANLSDWPAEKVEALRQVLKGETISGPPTASVVQPPLAEALEVTRSLPHGHVAAVLSMVQQLGLDALLDFKSSRHRRSVLAIIVNRILEPASKLATARALRPETCHSTLGEELALKQADEDDLYEAMDWILPRQAAVEAELAKRHLSEGTLVLYDVTSSYFEGHSCPLAQYGHSRDERSNNPQIVFGLLCASNGCPVAVEVFEGNTADPKTLAKQLTKLRDRFHISRLVLIGDRGMLTQKRIEEELRSIDGLDWITALRAPQIQKLVNDGALQLSLFDDRDLAEITHPDYPGERLVVCRNPLLAEERKRKREELIEAAEKKLATIVTATRRKKQPLKDISKINFRIGKELGPLKVAKYFQWEMRPEGLVVERNEKRIQADAILDGVYVLRTSVAADRINTDETVLAYKRLAGVERAFRSTKSVDLHVRPIHHRSAGRVRAHIFLCMLAYYVEWHMRRKLAPVLFDDEHSGQRQGSAVTAAQRSPSAITKAHRKRTPDDFPVQSFQDWLKDLATIVRNRIQPKLDSVPAFTIVTRPTPAQRRALDLLGVSV
jgi:transposase